MKFNFLISIDTETNEFTVVNKETGVSKTQPVKQSFAKEDDNPRLILNDNNYSLNMAAIELLGVSAGDKLVINYDDKGGPVIGSSSSFGTPLSGNQLTKSNTVRYSGVNNTRLAERGKIFNLVAYPNIDGLFNLVAECPVRKVSTPEVQEPDDLDLNCLLDDLDDSGNEAQGLDFVLD